MVASHARLTMFCDLLRSLRVMGPHKTSKALALDATTDWAVSQINCSLWPRAVAVHSNAPSQRKGRQAAPQGRSLCLA